MDMDTLLNMVHEYTFRLLYVLAANPQTSEPTLRYLR